MYIPLPVQTQLQYTDGSFGQRLSSSPSAPLTAERLRTVSLASTSFLVFFFMSPPWKAGFYHPPATQQRRRKLHALQASHLLHPLRILRAFTVRCYRLTDRVARRIVFPVANPLKIRSFFYVSP